LAVLAFLAIRRINNLRVFKMARRFDSPAGTTEEKELNGFFFMPRNRRVTLLAKKSKLIRHR
jgi:hypothetical protein